VFPERQSTPGMIPELVDERERVVAHPPGRSTQDRAAVAVFAAIELAGFIFYLVAARNIWFFRDDWEFLAERRFNLHDLLAQHGGHLVALPLAVYRAMYFVVGLRSYLPYQLMTIALHLVAALLLRVVMRRAGVSPWVATLVAGGYVFFGSGSQDVLWAFQIAFSGPLVLGLAQVLLADHDGPLGLRDWLGLGAGFAALMCSGVAVTMIGVVGLAVLIRRGWRAAAFHTVPLGAVYAGWWLHYARSSSKTVTSVSQLYDWFRTGLTGAFDALGEVPFAGWAIAAMLAVGLVLAWRRQTVTEFRRHGGIPAAMLVGAAAFLVISGLNRAWIGTQFAASSRYLDIIVALLLPALAVAADALIRTWRASLPVVLILLLIGIPGNVRATGTNFYSERYFADYEHMMRSLPRAELAQRVPRDLRPELSNAPWVTVGWLLDGAHSGRIPAARASTPREQATSVLRLSLYQVNGGTAAGCSRLSSPRIVDLAPGDAFVVRGTILVQLIADPPETSSNPVTFGATFLAGGGDQTIRDVGGPLTIRIGGQSSALLCGLPVHSTS
jgi:hypothetical protein